MSINFELSQLSHFLMVAKMGNFTHASHQIRISQPALSRSIQKLEQAIGEPLFVRQPRGVRLSEVGKLLQIRANQIIELAEDTATELSDVKNKGQIRLGVIPTIAPYLLPSILKSLVQKHPEIKVHIQEDTTQNIIQKCKNGDIDLAIVALPIHEKYLKVEPLFEDELILVVPKGHKLEKKKTVDLSEIQDLPFISLDKQHCLSDNIAEYCNRKSIAPVTVEQTNQLATILELVSLQHGVSIIPRMTQKLDKNKSRTYKNFRGEKPSRTISLLFNPNRYERKFVSLFKEHLRYLISENKL